MFTTILDPCGLQVAFSKQHEGEMCISATLGHFNFNVSYKDIDILQAVLLALSNPEASDSTEERPVFDLCTEGEPVDQSLWYLKGVTEAEEMSRLSLFPESSGRGRWSPVHAVVTTVSLFQAFLLSAGSGLFVSRSTWKTGSAAVQPR